MARGTLRIYLGAAPGVGKTFAMLGEAHRRASRGTDVVVGLVETHGRGTPPSSWRAWRSSRAGRSPTAGSSSTELDVEAVIARRPEVVVIDELAHTNVPGSRNPKRWQDVDEILDAGIHVLTTVNIQHLESLNDVVEQITGITQQETVPDAVVRRADQIELVDMTPEALRRRMAHGNVYRPSGSTPRWPTTSGSATSPRCASWRCCGWPTGSTRGCAATGPSTTSTTCGRPGNGSSSR